MSGRFVELGHVIRAGMVTYPGLPGPRIEPRLTREASRARPPVRRRRGPQRHPARAGRRRPALLVPLVQRAERTVDDPADDARPAHTVLLAGEVPVVEHLTGLHQLPEQGATFTAVPLRVERVGTIPVRAFARLP